MSTGKTLDIQVVDDPPWRQDLEQRLTRHPSREHWLKARQDGIGGSESAIVLGASPWGSPYQLWSEKAGLVPIEDTESEILRFGRVVEPMIASEYERLTGRRLINLGDWAIRKHPNPRLAHMFATHDRMIAPGVGRSPPPGCTGPGVLSIKSANVWRGVEWEDNEEPPLPYQVQFQHELACSGLSWGSFAVLVWGKGVLWQDAIRNHAFIDVLETECTDFWRRVVEGDPPAVDGSDHTTDALRRLHPTDTGEVVELPEEARVWAVTIEEAEAEIKRFTAMKDECRNKVRKALGDASEGYVPDGGPAWTYYTRGASPARSVPEVTIPEHVVSASPGIRYLVRKGNGKKRKP